MSHQLPGLILTFGKNYGTSCPRTRSVPRLQLAALFRSGSRGVRYGGWRGDAQTPGGLDRLTLPRPSRPDFGDEQKLKTRNGAKRRSLDRFWRSAALGVEVYRGASRVGVSGALPLGCAERLRLSGQSRPFLFSFAPPEGRVFHRRECGRYLAPITERRSLSAQRAAKPLVIISTRIPFRLPVTRHEI